MDDFAAGGPIPPELEAIMEASLAGQKGSLEGDGLFCLRELLSLIPKGHTFTLPSGGQATFVPFIEPKMREGSPYAMLDAKITGGVCDHFGFAISLTDHGGWVAPADAA